MPNPAKAYENYMVPALFAPCARVLIEAARLRAGESVLDIGCGTGVVSRQVAKQLGSSSSVVGIDISPNMLAVARAAAERDGVTVSWRQGNAERLAFPDRSFDVVLCQFALMFVTQKGLALSEMHRVATAHGRVLISVWQSLDRHPFYQALHTVIQQRVGMSAVQDIFALGNAQQLRQLVTNARFRRVEIAPFSVTARFPNPETFIASEIEVDTAAIPSMQRLDDQSRREIVAAITSDMQSSLEEVTHDNEVVLPFHGQIVTARR
jgi:ubiquinone/menaquinone biosynthesis C-methylase UbiE